MKEPLRLRDDPTMPAGLRSALRAGITTRTMTKAERARSQKRVAALTALPVAASALLGWKGVVLAAVAIGTGTVTALVGAPWRAADSPTAPAPMVATGAVARAAAATATTTAATGTAAAAPESAAESQGAHARLEAKAKAEAEARAEAAAAQAPAATAAAAGPAGTPPASPDSGRAAASTPAAQGASASAANASRPAAPSPSAAEPQDTLRAEAAVLERARARAAGDPAGALAILEEHARAFPRGKLSVERELIAVDVLRRAGRSADARARGEALLARTRGGLYEQRVRALLESMGAKPPGGASTGAKPPGGASTGAKPPGGASTP